MKNTILCLFIGIVWDSIIQLFIANTAHAPKMCSAFYTYSIPLAETTCANILKTVTAKSSLKTWMDDWTFLTIFSSARKLATRAKRYLKLKWSYYSSVRTSQACLFLVSYCCSQFHWCELHPFPSFALLFNSCLPASFPLHLHSLWAMMPSQRLCQWLFTRRQLQASSKPSPKLKFYNIS